MAPEITQSNGRQTESYTRFPFISECCQVSFLFRGKDEKKLHEAMDALAGAGAQAARLISRLKAQGKVSRQIVYEFDKEATLWVPSFVLLNDDRIITDNLALIAIENLPNGLSLGLTRTNSL